MSTESNKRAVVVGIFVLLGIIIFVAGVFVLGGQQKRFTKSIRLIAVFKDVSGLKAGNNVWFSGVKVGTVKRVSIYSNAQVEVDMDVEQSSKQFIRKDASASISSDGLIGNKIVVIVGGTNSHPEVEDGDRLQTQAALSSDQIMATLQENNNNLLRVTNDFKELVGNLRKGKGTVGAVLTDSIVANNFKRAMLNLEKASDNTVKVTGAVSQFAAKLNAKGTLANELVTDTTVFRQLSRSAGRLESAATSADVAVGSLRKSTENFNRASEKLNNNNSPLGVLLTDQETANNLRITLRNLNRGSALLNEDLKAAQNNFLLRGFFKKQAKEDAKRKADSTATKP
ncbi:MlaD family protein [Spirosoma endbachense]|jgi:phospholipid/cholesterol/gamma-HCH transport system substrate-binding protein|uniref:MCE family protein n=1 Tax=Spirosoma endbachense TaxID=2666025 RepID=A0A6P1VSG8_9BACT|nr:MlaD family protein [Spirosoma endbachense]QHV94920.1 MCE family protein [Spirosoma endbachense]